MLIGKQYTIDPDQVLLGGGHRVIVIIVAFVTKAQVGKMGTQTKNRRY